MDKSDFDVSLRRFRSFYGTELGKKKSGQEEEGTKKLSKHTLWLQKQHQHKGVPNIDPLLEEQFNTGRLLACISSRPGQVGRADGYILEVSALVRLGRERSLMRRSRHYQVGCLRCTGRCLQAGLRSAERV